MPPRPDHQEHHGSEREDSLESLRFQNVMERRNRALTAVSNIMKRLSETQKNMIDKLK